MPQLPEPEAKNPYRRANSLAELLSWHDLDFVRCAYVTLLGRQPDLSGLGHHVEQIRAGRSKLEILARLRQSDEAKRHDPGIAGLDRALKRATWQRRPLLGAASRLLNSDADGDSRTDRALRALLNAIFINQLRLEALEERLSSGSSVSDRIVPGGADPSRTANLGQSNGVAGTLETEIGTIAERTPELDHLREKAATRLFLGDVAR